MTKTFRNPLKTGSNFSYTFFKLKKHFAPLLSMAKISSSCVKTTSKLVVPPLPYLLVNPVLIPPFVCRGKT